MEKKGNIKSTAGTRATSENVEARLAAELDPEKAPPKCPALVTPPKCPVLSCRLFTHGCPVLTKSPA
jgi:hypothetical protein